MPNRVLAVALCAQLACSGTRGAAPPAPPTSTVRHYRPLEMMPEARRADRAVILGTDERDRSTVLVLPPTPRSVAFDAMLASADGPGPSGAHLLAITLTVAMTAPAPTAPGAPNPASRPASTAPGAPNPASHPAPTAPGAPNPASHPAPTLPRAPAAQRPPTRSGAAPIAPSNAAPPAPSNAAPPAPSNAAPPAPSSAAPTAPRSAAPTAPSSAAPTAPSSAAPTAPSSAAPPAPSNAAPTAPRSAANNAPNGLAIRAGDPAWEAALSIAHVVAAAALGKDPTDIAITAAPAMLADGTAAAALIAAGVLAALTGEALDPAATLAGTLHPDGTIGPVAGLPEQVLAALGGGKTRIGIPAGMRTARSQAGRDVDLVELARTRRVELVELATVHDAYRLMTRKPLPAPVPVDEADMALDPATVDGLRTRYLDWQKRLAGEWASLLQLEQSGRLPADVAQLVRSAHQRSEQAEALYRAGAIAAAYRRMRSAWVDAASANDAHGVLAKLHAGDVAGAAAAIAALEAADASAGGLVARIGELRPTTLAGHLALIAALRGSLRGASLRAAAGESLRAATELLAQLQGKPPGALRAAATTDAMASAVARAATRVRSAIAELTVAEQELALAPDRGVAYTPSPPDIRRLAGACRTAAGHAMRHVDALLVTRLAHGAGLSDDVARQRVAANAPGYLIAELLARQEPGEHAPAIEVLWSADAPAALFASFTAYQLSAEAAALLTATHGSFSIHLDQAGRIDRVEPGETFRQLLAAARRSALATARAARVATGEVPIQARLAYQVAIADEAGDPAAQLDALAELWTASALSHTAVLLSRAGRP